VFFDDAQCDADDIVGAPGDGWKVAMGLLGFERGVSTLGQQMLFQNELNEVIAVARNNGAAQDPLIRQRIADAHIGLKIMRYNSMRMLSGGADGSLQKEALIYKLHWATWHRCLGELAMDVFNYLQVVLLIPLFQIKTSVNILMYKRAVDDIINLQLIPKDTLKGWFG